MAIFKRERKSERRWQEWERLDYERERHSYGRERPSHICEQGYGWYQQE